VCFAVGPLPFGGAGDEPEPDPVGGLTLAKVALDAGVALVGGGGDTAGGGELGCAEGAGEGAGEGVGFGVGLGVPRGCDRGRGLAGNVDMRVPVVATGRGPSTTSGNRLVVTRKTRGASVVPPAAGANDDNRERCCAAGTPAPDEDEFPTSSACRQRCTDSAAPPAATTAQSEASAICFMVSVSPLGDDPLVQVACGSTLTTRFLPCRFAL